MARPKARPSAEAKELTLSELSASRLSAVSGIAVEELIDRPVLELREKYSDFIDPLIFFRTKVCGKVVKTDPSTGVEYPVPYATVQVEDTDCSFLGYFPDGSPWSWYFPFFCKREVIAETKTDACGNFCVWVPRWDIDHILRWRAEKVCFPIIFERPNLRDLIEKLIPERIPRPPFPPEPDPGPWSARTNPEIFTGPEIDRREFEVRLAEGLGSVRARQVMALESGATFGADTLDLEAGLAAPAYTSELAPPLPEDIRVAIRDDILESRPDKKARKRATAPQMPGSAQQLAAKLHLDAADIAGLDLRRYIGPFKRCYTTLVPEWTLLVDVPDITFRVTQDVDGDGDEEAIYSESFFQVRWNETSMPFVKIEADPQARAGVPCGPEGIPCADEPAIVMAGRLPVADVPTLYDPLTGYSVRTNRPHPTGAFIDSTLPKPAAAAPLSGVVSLYGCKDTDDSATHYRVMFEYSANNGVTYSTPAPFLNLSWPLFRLDGSGHAEWHYPSPDANGWYPITLPAGPNAWLPQDLLLDWPTTAFKNGRYRLTLQLGTGGTAFSSASDPVAFTIDNSAPSGPMQVEWSFSSTGPFAPLSTFCPVVRRRSSPVDVYFRVTLDAAATHLRSASMWAAGCGVGGFEFVSGTGGVHPSGTAYQHWHQDVTDNTQTLQAIYRLPSSVAEGTYSFGALVSSRAFSPTGYDGGHLKLPAWEYDPDHIHIWPSRHFSVINANPAP